MKYLDLWVVVKGTRLVVWVLFRWVSARGYTWVIPSSLCILRLNESPCWLLLVVLGGRDFASPTVSQLLPGRNIGWSYTKQIEGIF